MRHNIVFPFLFVFSIFLFKGSYAAWSFFQETDVSQNVEFITPSWNFIEGSTIEIDDNGNATDENGNTIEAEPITINNEQLYDDGNVSLKFKLISDDKAILTEFNTTYIGTQWYYAGSNIYLPVSVSVAGNTYQVIGIDGPLNINSLQETVIFTNDIYIPEGYITLGDGAFERITIGTTNFHLPVSLQSIGNGVFNPSSGKTQTIYYAGSSLLWNSLVAEVNYNKGEGNININFSNY